MSLQDLPPEVIDIIVHSLTEEKGVLYQVSLVSSALRAHAEIVLYSDVVIPSAASDRVKKFATTIRNNPRLASLVKFYSGNSTWRSVFDTPDDSDDWIHLLVNLKRLRLRVISWLSSTLPTALEWLEFIGGYESIEADRSLAGLDNLKYIKFRDFFSGALSSPPNSPSSPLVRPNLKVLCGSLNSASIILPGRRIRRFEWLYSSDDTVKPPDRRLHRLSPQLAKIRSLTYKPLNVSDVIRPLYDLSDLLTSLQFLELRDMHADNWFAVPNFRRLRVLMVLPRPFSSTTILDEPDRIIDLFNKCRYLERVDVGGEDYRETSTCKRWTRGSKEPITIPLYLPERGRTEFINDGDG